MLDTCLWNLSLELMLIPSKLMSLCFSICIPFAANDNSWFVVPRVISQDWPWGRCAWTSPWLLINQYLIYSVTLCDLCLNSRGVDHQHMHGVLLEWWSRIDHSGKCCKVRVPVWCLEEFLFFWNPIPALHLQSLPFVVCPGDNHLARNSSAHLDHKRVA